MQLLMQNGVDVAANACGTIGKTALEGAAEYRRRGVLVSLPSARAVRGQQYVQQAANAGDFAKQNGRAHMADMLAVFIRD